MGLQAYQGLYEVVGDGISREVVEAWCMTVTRESLRRVDVQYGGLAWD